MLQFRRNIDCLTAGQLHDLREAWATLYQYPESSPNSYLTIAGIHGEPAPYDCIHSFPGFATWHRAYLLRLERALQCIHPSVTIPFWNWSKGPTTGLPSACSSPTYVDRAGNTVSNPLYAGPMPGGGTTNRGGSIDTTTFDDLAVSAQDALLAPDYATFSSLLNGVHGSVHGRIGGDMGSVPFAGFDPIFHMHHANVDRLWAVWQQTHPELLEPDEATLELEPFMRPDGSGLYTGQEMFSTTALGYRYFSWCKIMLGPWKLKNIKLKWLGPVPIGPKSRAVLVLKASKMPRHSAQLHVFFNEPKADLKSVRRDNPNYAGSMGLFGMIGGRSKTAPKMIVRANERFDISLDITSALRHALGNKRAATLTIVAVGPNGKTLPAKSLHFDSIELHQQ